MNYLNYMFCILFNHKIKDEDEESLEIFNKENLNVKCKRCDCDLIIYLDKEDSDYYYIEEQ
ncbi:hypothetical protein [Nitrososphaeria virus YSH_462411]|uniref:Uncharacterized protein n=1 Tax=Nitrososphaeria virus YSH_462411 TaxID=3071321 RepID=A0A976YF33_9CAUD|nr:hypothetical protein QKV92_gp47 [Yangshan Harbor Nitrososphaeria virus]UVF62319.1 hypothetical protein [Nitrososphaeria virus YSH_462411]